MVLFIILGVIVLITFVVLGFLFYMLSKEGKKEEEKAVPVTDLDQLKKELSSGPALLKPQTNKTEDDPGIIPAFVPKVTMPTQPAVTPLENENYKQRAQELENELKIISQKADGQSDEAKKMIESLTQENESLRAQKADLEQAEHKLDELQGEASNLKFENASLQTQLESTNAKVQLLEEAMAAVKLQMGEEISRANQTVTELTREKEEMISAPQSEADQSLRQELDSLNAEQTQLKQKYDDLERAHQKMCELNSSLSEKNDALQYELVKARAQASGLERVSFNYKNQLEDFFKKVNAVQVTNDHLAQVKDRLEGMMESVRSQNEELVKKDQLSQFELEKNRTRLVSLEREYEDLKARVAQGGSQ
jgi:chromosome segregation ATPase